MRILFLDDDGMTELAPYVRFLGHVPVVLRTGVYDRWHDNESTDPQLEVHTVHPESTPMEVLDQARKLHPDALVSLALLDPYCWRDAIVADYFRECMRIPVIANAPACVLLAADKWRTKQLLKEHGIAVSEAMPVADLGGALEAARVMGFPLVLKRNDGYSGQGMRLFEHAEQLQRFYRRQPSHMIAEHFEDAIELSVDVLRWNGRVTPLTVIDKGQTERDLRRHPIYRLRLAPAQLDRETCESVLSTAGRAVDALGLVGLAECELLLHPTKGPLVLEVNPRLAGTSRLSAAATGLDLHKCLVNMALGRYDADGLTIKQHVAVQIPATGALTQEVLARLAANEAVKFVKPIDWMPELGISASLTVASLDPENLAETLQEIDTYLSLQPALSALRLRMAI